MESRFVVTALIFSILAACSKQAIHENSSKQTLLVQQVEKKPEVYSSGWETVPAWKAETTSDAKIFSYSRQMPELNNAISNNAAVLVFARNLWADDLTLNDIDDIPEKPLMMPFYFLPYFERPDYTEQWSFSASENKINILLIIRGGADAVPNKKVQLKYIVIPADILNQKKKTTAAVRKLSYDQLIKIFGLSS